MGLKKNEMIELKIDSLTSEGSGIGKYNGMAVFVANSAVGDFLKVKIIKLSKNYAVGLIEKIIEPSVSRIESDCPKALQCGGCVFRHISYEAELAAKQQRVQDAIERIGGFHTLIIDDIVGAPCTDRYRNKAQYPVRMGKDGIQVGFFAARSHRMVECGDCKLQPAEFFQIVDEVLNWAKKTGIQPYDEVKNEGVIRHLYLRKAEKTNQIMVCIVIHTNKLHNENELAERIKKRVPSVVSIMINQNNDRTNVVLGKKFRTIYGENTIKDRLCGYDFILSPRSFYQVNRTQAEVLYSIAKEYASLSGKETLLDLYCGTGTIGLSMAKNCKQLIGVEIIPEAIENAKENMQLNHIDNARFLCADAQDAALQLKNEGIRPNIVILDPPRKGCDQTVIHTIAQMNPEKIIYVSCDPATLARDMKLFNGLGYSPKKVTPVDMFPRTAHVETVVLMSRVEK